MLILRLVRLSLVDQRSARLLLLTIVAALTWLGVLAVISAPVMSVTGVNYLIAAPSITILLIAFWRGWDRARHVIVLLLSVVLGSTVPLPAGGWPYPPQGLILPVALATLLAGPRWVVGSAFVVFSIVFLRAGGVPAGLTPQNMISTAITVACLAITRLVLEAGIRDSQANAHRAEQARADAEARAAEVRFQAMLLDAVDEALVAVDAGGTISYWNRGAERLFGATAAEQVGSLLRLDLVPQRQELFEHLKSGRPFSGEVLLQRRDHGPFPALVRSWPIHDDAGVYIGSISVTLDQTERQRAETQLRDSEARFRLLADNSPDLILRYQFLPERRWLYVSPAAAAFLGYTPDEYYADPDIGLRFVMPEDQDALTAVTLGRAALEQSILRFRHRNGLVVWGDVRRSYTLGPDGEPIGYIAVVRDITASHAREVAQQLLAEIDRRILRDEPLDVLLPSICDRLTTELNFELAWIGLKQPDGAIRVLTAGGPAVAYVDGLQVRWDDAPEGRGPAGRVIRTGEAMVGDLEHDPLFSPWRERAQRYGLRSSLSLPLSVRGETIGELMLYSVHAPSTGVFNNASAESLANFANQVAFSIEAAERRAQISLQSSALEASANAIVIADSRGVVTWANAAFERLAGYTREEVVGSTLRLQKSGLQDHAFYQQLWETIRAGRIWHGELVNRRKDGSLYTEEQTITPVHDANGLISHYVSIKQDITERKRLEGQLRQAQKMEALGQMASGLAHDFNNALTMIVGGVEILQMRDELLQDEAEVRKYLNLMSVAAEDAGSVVGRLRELYRPRGEGAPFQIVDLGKIVHESIELTRPRWESQAQAAGAQIDVRAGVASNLRILGSGAELREALMNLIFNAVDAMPTGGVIFLRVSASEGHVLLSVSDTGCGMTDDVRERCLEPFFTTKGDRGSGLGLGMVYGVVRRHNGTLTIDSTPGVGTSFNMRFPLAGCSADVSVTDSAAGTTERLRILIVDDEPRILDILRTYLHTDGHEVVTASSGADALDRITGNHFDLLITDRAMPGISGDTLAAAARRIAPTIRIIMLTGFGQLMRVSDDLPTDVDLLLDKPLQPAKLRRAVADVMA